MSKLFLAAGVAALAIAAPAMAGPGGHGNGPGGNHGGVRGGAQKVNHGKRGDARVNVHSSTKANAHASERAGTDFGRGSRAMAKDDHRGKGAAKSRGEWREDRAEHRMDDRAKGWKDARDGRQFDRQWDKANGRGFADGCPPGLAAKNNGCLPPGQAKKLAMNGYITPQTAAMIRAAKVAQINQRYGYNLAAPATAASLLGLPLAKATGILPLAAVPDSIRYLYPSTPTYDYRYNDGYIYQVDKGSNLVSALIPLLAGGLLPGQTLPSAYMNSSVPNYYGYNAFYPSSPNLCSRYANGVVYSVDCASGVIANVTPMYNNGYGVGQLLPSSYSYYNVPDQYRNYYYNSADAGYWYAPGAIYQYDPKTSLITSVAALLSPGMTVGQPMPVGYSTYNLPMAYRDQYADSATAWYRYANGSIYQVDPVTQLVTALVASALS